MEMEEVLEARMTSGARMRPFHLLQPGGGLDAPHERFFGAGHFPLFDELGQAFVDAGHGFF
jgi:hypothetical protein